MSDYEWILGWISFGYNIKLQNIFPCEDYKLMKKKKSRLSKNSQCSIIRVKLKIVKSLLTFMGFDYIFCYI